MGDCYFDKETKQMKQKDPDAERIAYLLKKYRSGPESDFVIETYYKRDKDE